MYDVIIVGARGAGASTAMLLARRGLKVLVVDRATFPSDTLSTHQVQLPGVARLARGGVLVDAARAAGAEVRENFAVEEILGDGQVTGIRGQEKGAPAVTEQARLVIGADGKHSLVAPAGGARAHR